ncbi:hypothetical protein [Isachenkonia alkalipeptolytica]|uniref:Uncharacterized protein n=1 Tax=Isachenkonia alkalipeptolytica TaxID=2565777 RepID=A0AA43XJ49_9CLOT|nr:hypothetical protein [Isachenkonia alkalipeptolytica]NBG87788.1 hypothetical protein [Isachenkonia alkalipeptolytica]
MDHIFIVGGVLFFLFFFVSFFLQKARLPSLLSYIFLGVALSSLLTESELNILYQRGRRFLVHLLARIGRSLPVIFRKEVF